MEGYLQTSTGGGGFDWFYASGADRAAQIRTPITDGSAGKPGVFRIKDFSAWWPNLHFNRPGGLESGTSPSWVPQSKPIWFNVLGCPAIGRGTSQPNVFFDAKPSESYRPHFSRGWRDDASQRAYLEETWLWWGVAANSLTPPVYGGRMIHPPKCAAWAWAACRAALTKSTKPLRSDDPQDTLLRALLADS
ncbi:glycoside hydrolase TIM-barrel-like domain-containing protein [Pannonibacter sp. Pt2]|uniref:Glycoside hydrolase TIM-barrel-like domain-containing protein n=1 Tax=Pannonibacter anstelovis TaxID=3121537 RepID=A0ABU7ZRD7_9HYPH